MKKETLEFLKNLADQKMNILDNDYEYEEMNIAQMATYQNCQNAIAEINKEFEEGIETEVEYKVIFTRPGLKYWGEFMHRFKTYSDAEVGLKDFMKEYGSGIYRIIKETREYEIVKEEIRE